MTLLVPPLLPSLRGDSSDKLVPGQQRIPLIKTQELVMEKTY